ncbi:MAG: toprim domain-containing protein [Patescibacteria group bacterium]
MDSARKLAEYFSKFPGIGPRQARRFVYFLLSQNGSFAEGLSRALADLKNAARQCESCKRFFEETLGKSELCDVCRSPLTDKTVLMVVEKDIDFENVRKSGVYKGQYFILGGLLPILEKNPVGAIRIRELISLIEKLAPKGGLKEIIIALSANTEGDNTFNYIKKTLEPIAQKYKLAVSGLGRGFSTGLEIEYSDAETLGNALKNRG